MEKYEEYTVLKSQFWGWVILIIFSAVLFGWGMAVHMVVPERPREWDFGTIPDTPALSAYSTAKYTPEANVPRQTQPLPGAGWDRKTSKPLHGATQ